MDNQDILKNIKPTKEFFVGIDSDGCVFDTMEVKQKEFFIPLGIRYFDLFPISGIVRETWEFVNLYSKYRGVNRFPALIQVFKLLEKRKDLAESGFKLPDMGSLEEWIKSESKLGNNTLVEYINLNPSPILSKVLDWSLAINDEIGKWLNGIQPFRYAVPAIEMIYNQSDSIVVSQTPLEALEREWKEHNIDSLVKIIAGQEYGTKTEHLALAAKNKYPDHCILMIGDAPGDLKAAEENNVCFYPIIPGKEQESWKRLIDEAFGRFSAKSYKGDYEDELLRQFDKSLPEKPPWDQI